MEGDKAKIHWTKTPQGRKRMSEIMSNRNKKAGIHVKSHHKMMTKDIIATSDAKVYLLCNMLWKRMTGDEKWNLIEKHLET